MIPQPFEIARQGGALHATNGARVVTALDVDARMFRRRAVKRVGNGEPQYVEWCVVELNGVRVYVDGEHVIVTRQDLNP